MWCQNKLSNNVAKIERIKIIISKNKMECSMRGPLLLLARGGQSRKEGCSRRVPNMFTNHMLLLSPSPSSSHASPTSLSFIIPPFIYLILIHVPFIYFHSIHFYIVFTQPIKVFILIKFI